MIKEGYIPRELPLNRKLGETFKTFSPRFTEKGQYCSHHSLLKTNIQKIGKYGSSKFIAQMSMSGAVAKRGWNKT